ncbi:RagB/SusD family nutrient uptake outer membrane protein [Porphyromonas endodontalis]|jgi:putative lipoprotein ragB|uniref:RagB/SusD family nutrient uptake outer membrane protein n=1 Tax=Porphyromonas endodontalis TaxID=28124 RepID=UPI0028EC8D6B|nr:RagB/SusD family nutrient uptake outer membrane protein [Porphyromonas endodontalis]
MKKIAFFLSAILAFATIFTSCDVTRLPEGTPLQEPFQDIKMAKQNRDAVYALLIGVESPNNLNSADIQTDLFHLTYLDNNSLKGLYTWQEQSVLDHDNINSYYAAYYQTLMQANYFIKRAEELIASAEYKTTDEEKTLLKQYIGEIKIMRALAHWRLIQRFSKPWDGTTDNDKQSGIILMKDYKPLVVAKSEKATRAEVYQSMIEDLDYAIANIADDANKDVKPAIYLTRDYAYAVKARVCLTKHDWQGAVDACDAFIDKYPINTAGDAAAKTKSLASIWQTEDSPEILVRLRATAQEGAVTSYLLSGRHMEGYKNPNDYKDKTRAWFVYYLPSLVLEKWVVDLYSANDIRKDVYIGTKGFYRDDFGLNFNTLTKYSGNPSLNTDAKVFQFKFGVHLFNVAEAYLIKAEALAELGKTADAADVIVKLEKSRLSSGYPDPVDFGTKEEVLKEIRNERVRELVGEGFRTNDLVRWGMGFKRSEPQAGGLVTAGQLFGTSSAVQEVGKNLEKEASDKMFIWEFPLRDRENNENLQNFRNWR